MTLLQMLNSFWRDAFDVAEPHLFPRASVVEWLNEAEEEGAIRKGLLYAQEDIDIAAGDKTATTPTGWHEITRSQIVDSQGVAHPFEATDLRHLYETSESWRTDSKRPERFVHQTDGTIVLSSVSDAAYTIKLEGYRLPSAPLALDADVPEIPAIHHRRLIWWALFRGYSIPDTETFDAARAKEYEDRFDHYFGRRITADLRKRQQANVPHKNKLW